MFGLKRLQSLEEELEKMEYRTRKLESSVEALSGRQELFIKRIDEMSVTIDRLFNVLLEHAAK